MQKNEYLSLLLIVKSGTSDKVKPQNYEFIIEIMNNLCLFDIFRA